MGKIAKNYVYNIAYQIFILIVPLVTAPYLTRVLGAANMGTYSYVNSYATIVSNLSLLGIYNYGVRQIAYKRDSKEELSITFWELIWMRIILAILGTCVYFVFSERYYSYYIWLYYPWVLASYIDLSWLFVAVEDMRPAVLKNFFAKLLTVAGIFIFVNEKEDLWIYILLISVTTLVANISLIPQVKKYVGKSKVRWCNWKKHLKGTIILFLPQISTLLYLQLDKIMIEGMTGALEQISFYDQAEKIVKIPMTFITVLSTVMMPRIANEFSKGNHEKILSYLMKVSDFSIALSMPMIAGLMATANKLIPWYLDAEYIPTAKAIMVISPIVLSNALAGISGSQYFVAVNRMKIVVISNISAAILNIIINATLIPQYGYIGAAVASLIASYTIVIMQFVVMNKDIKVLKILHSFPRYLINSILMYVIIQLITSSMGVSAITTMVQIFIGLVTYFVLLVLEKDALLLEGLKFVKALGKRRK